MLNSIPLAKIPEFSTCKVGTIIRYNQLRYPKLGKQGSQLFNGGTGGDGFHGICLNPFEISINDNEKVKTTHGTSIIDMDP
jgi:hypothetical protein